mgnify:FL=1
MKKLNNKGFTLIEVLAVIAIIAILGLIAVPGVLNSINNGKKSSYNIMISNIKTASQTLFEEVNYTNTELYQYNSNGIKSTTKVKTEKVYNNKNDSSIAQIQTNLQTLVSNGYLKGTTKEENNEKILLLINPINNENIGFCKITIRKITDSNLEEKTTYEIISDDTNSSCPQTLNYQENPKTQNIGNYREDQGITKKYYFLNNNYTYYSNLILNSFGNLVVPSNSVTFRNQRTVYAINNNSNEKILLQSQNNVYKSYKISLSNLDSKTKNVRYNNYYKYSYSSTAEVSFENSDKLSLISPASTSIPTTNRRYTFFNTSSSGSPINYIETISKVINGTQSYYKIVYKIKNISKSPSLEYLSKTKNFNNSSSYKFSEYDGMYQLIGNITSTNVLDLNTNKYICLDNSTSCSTLYKVEQNQGDSIVLITYNRKKLT